MPSARYMGPSEMRMSVLIVDDEQAVRGAVKRLLEREGGIRVVGEAGDGEEAVRLARELRPDVVLMADRPEARVIILTVHGEEAYRRAAGESGADAFLPKKSLRPELLKVKEGINALTASGSSPARTQEETP